jgi:phage baseplate assembly protein W
MPDLDLSFSQTNTHDITILNTKAAVKASVKNIILVERGTAIFQPYFGTSLSKYLFEVADKSLGNEILEEIKTALTLYEPRVRIEKIEVVLEDDEITLSVNLEYTIKQLEETDSITISLIRDR